MKRLIAIIFAVLAMTALFCSCSKDSEEETEQYLAGRTYKQTDKATDYMVVSFTSSTAGVLSIIETNSTSIDHSFTYTYSEPKVKMTVTTDDAGTTGLFIGTIDEENSTLSVNGIVMNRTK